MKKNLFVPVLAIVVVTLCFSACTKRAAQDEVIYTIDEVYTQAEVLSGDTITFEGVCTHLCKHGGRKAFLMGSAMDTMYTDTAMVVKPRILRVEGAKMGNFDAACINNVVRVKGVLHSFEYQQPIMDNPGEQHGTAGQGCETEKAAIKGYYAEAISYVIVTE